MATKHQFDLVQCLRQPGRGKGLWCEKCEGRCPGCDSFVNPAREVRICDECNFGQNKGKCIICGAKGKVVAYWCAMCVKLQKDRDGCPMIISLGGTKIDRLFQKKKNPNIR